MRLKNSDYALLQKVREALNEYGRDDLTEPLGAMLREFEQKRERTRTANRLRAAEHRKEAAK